MLENPGSRKRRRRGAGQEGHVQSRGGSRGSFPRAGAGAPGEWRERWAGSRAGQTQTRAGPQGLSGSLQTTGKSPRRAAGGWRGHAP